MRFYEVTSSDGNTIGCELTIKAAHALAQGYGFGRDAYSITYVDVPVTAESIRRLLGHCGGYATDSGDAYPKGHR